MPDISESAVDRPVSAARSSPASVGRPERVLLDTHYTRLYIKYITKVRPYNIMLIYRSPRTIRTIRKPTLFFTARCYAERGIATASRPSVSLSPSVRDAEVS